MKAKFLAFGLCAVMATTAVFADDTSSSAATAPAMSGSPAPAPSGSAAPAPAPSAPMSGSGQVSQ